MENFGCHAFWLSCSLVVMQFGCHAVWLSCTLAVMQFGCHALWLSCSLVVMHRMNLGASKYGDQSVCNARGAELKSLIVLIST